MTTAAEEEGAFRTRPNFKASIEEPCQTIAVLQQRSVENGSSGSSDCLTGAAAKAAGDGGEERARSMSDIIAEAMRENGVQQQRRVEIIKDGEWPRKSTSTSAPPATTSLALVSLSPPPPPPPSPMPSTSTLKMKTISPGIAVDVTESQVQREPLAAGPAPPAPASEAPEQSANADGVDKDSGHSAVVITETTARNEIGVARAMAEAILDEGYMAAAASKNLGSGSTAPAAAVAGSEILGTKTLVDAELRSDGGELSCEASSSPHETSSTAIASNPACSRGLPHQKMSDTKNGGMSAPSVRRGGVDAPFGHAVIIEEHVRAVADTSTVNLTRKDTGRSLELHVGLNGIHAPAVANGGRKLGGKAKASGGSTGPGYSSCTTDGRHDEAQGLSKTAQAAPSAPAVGAAAVTAASTAIEPVAKMATGDSRIGWGAGEAAGVGDGFLSLQGGRLSLTTLASLAGRVARTNMSLPSRVGGASPGRDALKPPSLGSSAPEEFVLLQEEQDAEETGSRGESDGVVSGTVCREAERTFQTPTDSCPVRGGGGLFRLRDSFVGQSSAVDSEAPAADEEGDGVPEASEAEDPAIALYDCKNGGGSGYGDGSWAVAPGLDGTGLSQAEGGWGHVDGNGCLEEVHYDDEGEDREERVNDEASVGVSNGAPKASSDIRSPSNGWCGTGENQDPVAPKPEPKAEEIDQSELFVVEESDDEPDPLDGLTGKLSLCLKGAPACFSLNTEANAEADVGGYCGDASDEDGNSCRNQEARADPAVNAGEGVGDASDPSGCASVDSTDEREFEESQDGVEQAWGELVEDVAEERAPGLELPEPAENAGTVDTTLAGIASAGEGGGEEVGDDENGATVSEPSGDDKRLSEDGYQSSREGGRPATASASEPQEVGGGPPAMRSSGHRLVSVVAEVVGARTAVPQELLLHFVRAGGGDVSKAASLYRAVADEFVELRDMARKRRNANSSPKEGVPTMHLVGAAAVMAKVGGEGRQEGEASDVTLKEKGTAKPSDTLSVTGLRDVVMTSSSEKVASEVGEAIMIRGRPSPQAVDADFPSFEANPKDIEEGRAEYSVTISSQKLGMTVENVLERTVVRAAAPGGGAEAAGVETGSLLVALDGQSTKDSSHFEVIELLRVAKRPLTLRLRRVARERLLSRRAEMRALTRPHGVAAAATTSVAAPPGFGGNIAPELATAASSGSSHSGRRHSSPGMSVSSSPSPPPSPPPGRELRRQDSGHLVVPMSYDGGATGTPNAYGGDDGTVTAETAAACLTNALAAMPIVSEAPSGSRAGAIASNAAREQAAEVSTGNWEAVEWAESCLLTILRLVCVGEEVRALEEEKAAAAAAAAAATSTNGHREVAGKNGVSTQQAGKEDGGGSPIATFGERSPVKGGLAKAWGDGADADAEASVEGVRGEEPGLWRATEAEEAEAAHAHSEYIRREEAHKSIVRLLLEFSGMLERDWCLSRREDPSQGSKNADGTGNPICGGGSGAGGGGAASGTANRRMENMGALLEQLAMLIDWGSEVVAAVEPELRELLCVLLDADLYFDLSSVKFPHLVGGGVAAMLQELLMHLPTEQAMLEAPALAHRLALSNSVCARGSCCALVASTYGLPPLPGQLQLRGILSRLLHDRFQSVRGEAVKALAHVAPVADASTCRWLMLLGERATMDLDLSIRRASVDSLLQIGHRLLGVLDDHGGSRGASNVEHSTKGGEDAGELANVRREIHMLRGKLLPTLLRLIGDSEWQVRVEIACRLDFSCLALGEQCSAVTTDILPMLVVDADPDVRCEAIRCLPRVARILLGFAMSGCYSVDPSPSVGQNAIKPSATPVSSSSVGDDGGDDRQSSSINDRAVAKEQQKKALVAAGESGREAGRGGDASEASLRRSDVGDGAEISVSLGAERHIQLSDGSVDGREPVQEPGRGLIREPIHGKVHGPFKEPELEHAQGQLQEAAYESILNPVLESVQELIEAPTTRNQASESGSPLESARASETVFEALPEALSIPSREGGSKGCNVDGAETGGSVGTGDSGRAEHGGEISAAGERARRYILGALMPAAAVLIEDPTAEVRGTAAVSLGEMLRLMVGFEDYVSALGSGRSSSNGVVGIRAGETGGVSTEGREGRGAEGVRLAGSGGMVTCCCVTGEEEEGEESGTADGGEDFVGGLGRRVCHGKLLKDAEEAAAAAADAMAEAAMTAELMDLAGFEPVGDDDDEGDRDDVSGDEDGSDASEGFPVTVEEVDVDAHVNVLLRSDDDGAIVDATSVDGFPPSEGDVSPATEEEEAGTGADPPRLETVGGDEEDGSNHVCSTTENKCDLGFGRNGSPRRESAASAAAATRRDGDDATEDRSVEDGNGNCGNDVSGSLGDVAVTADGDRGATGGEDVAADVAGEAEAMDADSNGDPLIALVRRLLVDADANVACTMLQALRPAWGTELGPGPGPRAKTLRGVAEYAVPAAAVALEERDGGEGKGSGGEEIASHVRSCMLTPAQVGCVLPALAELYGNPLWRVRAAVAEALPALVSCTLCNRLKDEVIKLSRRMLLDRVDAVRRSAAEQLVMAARIDLDRCPARLLHHIPGACSRETPLPSVLHRPSSPALSAPSKPKPNSILSPNSVLKDSDSKDSVEAAVDSGRVMQAEGATSGSDEGTPRNDVENCMDRSTVDCTSNRVGAQASGEEWDSSRDRAGACGLWLRLVVVPLMGECLETSYRGKLLALHMTQAAFRLGVTTPAVMSSLVVPALLRGLADSVPNVRLTAARVADDVLSVAAMSSWPPPDGRSGSFNGEISVFGDGVRVAGAVDASPWGSRAPPEAGRDVADNGNGSDIVATSEGPGSESESVRGGAWWGCGWKEVELRLEALSGRDPDRDVAYFAAQALKPKWKGDVRRP